MGWFQLTPMRANAGQWPALLEWAPAGPHRSGGLPCCPDAWSRPVGHFASRAQRCGRPHERGRERLVDEAGGPARQV